MSSKEFPPGQKSVETTPEVIPTRDQVFAVFKRLLPGMDLPTGRICEDEQGLYLWEVRIKKEDGDVEYLYMRKGRFSEGQASKTAIDVAFYDVDGKPIGGSTVARFENGVWKIL